MLDYLFEEVSERLDDKVGALLVEQPEVHYYDRSVTVVPTAHIDDAALEHLLDLGCELYRKVLFSPVLVIL